MECIGIFIDTYTQRKLFNADLALQQGETIIKHNQHYVEDPEKMRQVMETGLKRCHPMVTVGFLDESSELEIDLKAVQEIGEYSLLIKVDAPFATARTQ